MKTVFVDTAYFVARFNHRDRLHQQARQLELQIVNFQLLTTEIVLIEFLNYFSDFGSYSRSAVAGITQDLLNNPNVMIIWQTQELFSAGLSLYANRLDKGYSLTDCVSMVVMRQEKIQEILTHDRHFAQEGFTILL
jgi:uncharacterized protein